MSHDLSHLSKNQPPAGTKMHGSIADRMANAAAKAQERLVIVQDCSTSMAESLRDGNVKLGCAKQAIEAFLAACDRRISAVGLVGFDSSVHHLVAPMQHYSLLLQRTAELNASGGTTMAPALSTALSMEPTRLILISDGCAYDVADTKRWAEVAKEQRVPIDAIYIGPDHDQGAELMRWIAEVTGGHFFTVSTLDQYTRTLTKLEHRNRLQLTHTK